LNPISLTDGGAAIAAMGKAKEAGGDDTWDLLKA